MHPLALELRVIEVAVGKSGELRGVASLLQETNEGEVLGVRQGHGRVKGSNGRGSGGRGSSDSS